MKHKTIKLSKANAIQLSKKVATELGLVFSEKIDETLYFKKRGNVFSFGNVISVKLTSMEQGRQKISVNSDSLVKIQLFDWGINNNLEDEFIEMIKESTKK